MKSAIILDGHVKSALAAVRSLGVQRVPIYCGATRGSAMSCHSKYVTERFIYPSPLSDQEGFIQMIRDVALRVGDMPVVFSFSDATMLTLFQYKEELASFVTLVFPSQQSMEIAFDKAATYSEAKISGVPTIATYLPEHAEEIPRIAKDLIYPAVVKPRHSATWRENVGVTGTAVFVHSEEELMEKFSKLKQETGEPPLVQEYVGGEEYGVELLCKDGEVLNEASHHRLRSMSPTGGASVLKETMEDDALLEEMKNHSYKFAEALSWTGPMMVEFKVDSDTRVAKLMEINGRFWGSLPLAIAAGVDFPFVFYTMAAGQSLPNTRKTSKSEVVTRHFLGDVRHLLRVLFARDRMRRMLYPKRTKALRDFFRLSKGTKSDVWNWKDPFPSIFEYIDVVAKMRGK